MPRGKYARRRAARLGVPNVGYYPPADGIPDDGAFRASPELVDALLDTFERPAPTGPTREELERQSLGPLRDLARELGLKPGRVRKAVLIDAIIAKSWAARNDG